MFVVWNIGVCDEGAERVRPRRQLGGKSMAKSHAALDFWVDRYDPINCCVPVCCRRAIATVSSATFTNCSRFDTAVTHNGNVYVMLDVMTTYTRTHTIYTHAH